MRAAGSADVRKEEGERELMMSQRVLSSLSAMSHLPVRISEASLIHREDMKVVETVCAEFRSELRGFGYVITHPKPKTGAKFDMSSFPDLWSFNYTDVSTPHSGRPSVSSIYTLGYVNELMLHLLLILFYL